MVGVLMFLFEFFDDQMMAFMVFSLVWVGEIFCILRVRGSPSLAIRKFPLLFLMMFLLFLLYVFSFPLGFTYVAFMLLVSAVGLSMLYLNNHVLAYHPRRHSRTAAGHFLGLASALWIPRA
eukprot:Tamp_24641.p2 GENE.Tamp_24641~~Tamp_24641.p2  ORF type:complete len:121 (-),score=13.74 Tamp_24641:12-374(-)